MIELLLNGCDAFKTIIKFRQEKRCLLGLNFFFDDFRISEFSCHCYYL